MCERCTQCDPSEPGASRRAFLLAIGMGVLAGCAKQAAVSTMPGPPWSDPEAQPLARPAPPAPSRLPDRADGIMPRSAWAGDGPATAEMNVMTSIRYITVHHDGMDPFYATDRGSTAEHLELIRRLHRRKGWGDIGYHYAIDPAGRVWEARPLRYQGAHVKDHNPGNIGIVVIGNFEEQPLSDRQLAGLRAHVVALMRSYNVPVSRVQTHQEWGGARTACPGGRLQNEMERWRRSGAMG